MAQRGMVGCGPGCNEPALLASSQSLRLLVVSSLKSITRLFTINRIYSLSSLSKIAKPLFINKRILATCKCTRPFSDVLAQQPNPPHPDRGRSQNYVERRSENKAHSFMWLSNWIVTCNQCKVRSGSA
eukprot:1530574-Amphidinium_carterae.1